MRLVTDLDVSAAHARKNADRELLANLAVVVGEDVSGVAVDADNACDLDIEAGLFAGLTDRALGNGLTELHLPARERPHLIVSSALKHDPVVIVDDDG